MSQIYPFTFNLCLGNNLDVWAHMVEFCCYNYILYMLYKWCNIIIWKYFFWWEKGLHRRFVSSTGGVDVSITNGSRYEPAVMGAHHQRFWNRRWWPSYHQRLKSNGTQNRWWCTFRTGGDRGGCSSVSDVNDVILKLDWIWTIWTNKKLYIVEK